MNKPKAPRADFAPFVLVSVAPNGAFTTKLGEPSPEPVKPRPIVIEGLDLRCWIKRYARPLR